MTNFDHTLSDELLHNMQLHTNSVCTNHELLKGISGIRMTKKNQHSTVINSFEAEVSKQISGLHLWITSVNLSQTYNF